MLYKAFISYSHAADGKLAPSLQRSLHRIAKPWYRLRAMRVFRDETNLATSPGLWTVIEQALGQSEFFIYLASSTAAQSPWVQKEVDWWLTNRSAQTFLIVLTDGALLWDNAAGDFDWSVTTALPRRTAKAFGEEPLHTDLRWAHSFDQLSLRHSRFRSAILDLAATLLGRPKDELDGDDVRQYRRTRRVAWSAAGVLGVLFVAATFAAWLATQQSLLATSRSLAARSEALLPTNPELALLLAREALRFREDEQADYALRRAFLRNPQRMIHHGPPGPNLVARFVGSNDVIVAEPGKPLVVWNLETGERRGELPIEAGDRVDGIGVAADSSLVIVPAADERTFALFDAKTLKPVATLPGSDPRFSGDGQLLSAKHGKTVRQWLVPSLQERKIATGLPAGFAVDDVSADGSLLMLARESEPSVVMVADAVSGRILSRLPQGLSREELSFTRHGRFLIKRGVVGDPLRLWEAESGKPVARKKTGLRDTEFSSSIAFNPAGDQLVIGYRDGSLQTWDLKTGELQSLFGGPHRNDIRSIEFSPDGQTMLSVDVEGNACLWDSASWRCLVELGGKGDSAWDIGFADSSERYLTTHLDGTVRIWKRDTWHPRQTFPARIELTGSSGRVVLGTTLRFVQGIARTDSVVLWDAATGKTKITLKADPGDVPRMAIDYDARFVAIAPEKSPAEVWSLQTGQRLLQVADPGAATALAFTRDGSAIATAGEDGRVRLWSTRDGSPLGDWPAKHGVNLMVALPDGQHLVMVADSGLSLRNVKTGAMQRAARLEEQAAASRAMAVSEDGSLVFLASDQSPQIWDLRSLTRVRTLAGHDDEVWDGGFSPDGRFAVTASGFFRARGTPPDNGNGAHLWDLRGGRLLLSYRSAGHVVKAVSFANGGTEIIAGSMDGTVRRYGCEVCLPLPRLVELTSARLARGLTDDERQRYVAPGFLGWIVDWLPSP